MYSPGFVAGVASIAVGSEARTWRSAPELLGVLNSSSVMVTVALLGVPGVTIVGISVDVSVTITVSLPSSSKSSNPKVSTVIVAELVPDGIATVPLRVA